MTIYYRLYRKTKNKGHITMQFKLTAFYALGILEIFKVNDPLKVSCST